MPNRLRFVWLALMMSIGPAYAQDALTVANAQPTGELASLEQAAEIRIRFSEPMVPIGRLPEQVTAPFVTVRPAMAGTFRWAGPTLLVFTPDPTQPVPTATRYDVTVAVTAAAVSGRSLDRPYTFTFTTPTVRLLAANWYRLNGRYDQPVILALRFNQAVRPVDALAHVAARYQRHDFTRPAVAPEARARMGADGAARFDAKVAAAAAVAVSTAAVPLQLVPDWDKTQFPPSADLVVLQTQPAPSTDGWLELSVDTQMPAVQGRATPPVVQRRTIRLDQTLFVDEFRCQAQCDADDYNGAHLRAPVGLDALQRAASVRDVTDRAREAAVPKAPAPTAARERAERLYVFGVEDLGVGRQPPSRTYAIALDAGLRSVDGQTLGYPWTGIVENWHERAFTSFGGGHGVWETGGGPLPFHARNFVDVRQWAQAIAPDRLMPTILDLTAKHFNAAPPGAGTRRTLGGESDKILSHGLDLSGALTPKGTGLLWAAVQQGQPIVRSRPFDRSPPIGATLVQVTNLGITVKDSPQNTLVFVTRLDTGAPVPGADVSIVRPDNSSAWSGRTDDHGIAIAPQAKLRNPRQTWKFAFLVTAAKDGDVAYVGSDWNEGIEPFAFGARYDIGEADPLLRGTVFSDRGVYKLGEEIHFKAILRRDAPAGIQLIAGGTPVYVSVTDSRNKIVDRRTVTTNGWSSTEWTLKLPPDGALGDYLVSATLDKASLLPPAPKPPVDDDGDMPEPEWRRTVRGSFLVAAYRRPEFRVDATLGSEAVTALAGAPLRAMVTARYLFGAPMANRPVSWSYSRTPFLQAPAGVLNRFPADRFAFVGCCDEGVRPESGQLGSKTAALDARGRLALDLETTPSDGLPYQYAVEGDVEDLSRQHIAGRASFIVHPAPWYVGLKRPPLFVEQKDGLNTTIVAVAPDGMPVAGVKVDVALVQVQWHSVRRAEGSGFYGWETERTETEKARFAVTSAAEPVPLSIPLPEGGAFLIRAVAQDGKYKASTRLSFYAVGAGYTAWERYDHNRIDLVPEKDTYKPGETARLMIQSPWEQATALLTVEREGIRSHTQFTLTSTQQTVTVPITAADIPNLFVSVLLVKGRSKADAAADASDPGKPSFRLGYAKLAVDDASKRLSLTVKANRDEFRPSGSAKIDLQATDAAGVPASTEVTLWAVDYGVLSLTAFRTPDVLQSVYVPKALEVMTEDTRQRIVSRRVLTPKGTADGGGGGADSTVSQLRKDFRVLAFWLGSVTTDSRGRASTDVKLPESLTTYRIMAVAGDKASRFGSGESEIRINKPVVLKAAFPRFMTRGDKAFFGSVVTSQLKEAGTAVVTMKSLDPDIVQIAGDGRQSVSIAAGGSTEVRFDVIAGATGRARIQTTVKLRNESDAFEDTVPVQVTVSPETVAAYGEAAPDAKQTFELPAGIVPGVGGLHVELASTALVGLGEGARYVIEYPFGCVEQRASQALVLAVAADLGDAFHLPGIDARDLRPRVRSSLRELEKYQCPSGGFAFWPGECRSVSPYFTSYVLSVYQTTATLKYAVDADVMRRGYDYLEGALREPPPVNEGWWPAFTAWEAFAVRVLVDGGRNQDSNLTRLYQYLDRMPVFALAYLHDALAVRSGAEPRLAELRRRIGNAVLPEAGTSHVEELSDPYLLWFFNSNIRSTAVALNTLVRANAAQTDVGPMVRWLVAARKNGRWGNTQENAVAMQALVSYYRKYESQVPNFTASVRLGAEDLVRATFKGRSAEATVRDVPMAALAKGGAAPRDLALHREGDGTLFYTTRLTYAPDVATLTAADRGFRVEREYAPLSDGKAGPLATTFQAGDLVRVTLAFDLPKERRYVAVTDPVPAGFEPVESWFATTASDVARASEQEDGAPNSTWQDMWRRGTFDHIERHDDRVLLFATRLASGHHEFSYVVRATTAGTFQAAPTRVEEMYEPEVAGRTSTVRVEIKR
jgi:uncharacterized protein YfaS (alpha-2-macroglobulin family)